jgi:hypothetical protein
LPIARTAFTIVPMIDSAQDLAAAVRRLADEYRDRCLWFLRDDFQPDTPEGQWQVLDYIERYGDLAGYRRARVLKRWLSQHTSAPSAG